MATHETKIVQSSEGVRCVCSCRQKQPAWVPTRSQAEDWRFHHLEQVQRARAGSERQLSPEKWLEYLRERAADASLPKVERDQWEALACEYEPHARAKMSRPYDTGVETEPLF